MDKQPGTSKEKYIQGKSMFSSNEVKQENKELTILSFLQKRKLKIKK